MWGALLCMWRSENSLCEWVLSYHQVPEIELRSSGLAASIIIYQLPYWSRPVDRVGMIGVERLRLRLSSLHRSLVLAQILNGA